MSALFKRFLAPVVVNWLSKVFSNVDSSHLSFSLWSGEVNLHDLELKHSVADKLLGDYLGLPVRIKSGKLKELKLLIPWTSLMQSPIQVTLDGLSIDIDDDDDQRAADEVNDNESVAGSVSVSEHTSVRRGPPSQTHSQSQSQAMSIGSKTPLKYKYNSHRNPPSSRVRDRRGSQESLISLVSASQLAGETVNTSLFQSLVTHIAYNISWSISNVVVRVCPSTASSNSTSTSAHDHDHSSHVVLAFDHISLSAASKMWRSSVEEVESAQKIMRLVSRLEGFTVRIEPPSQSQSRTILSSPAVDIRLLYALDPLKALEPGPLPSLRKLHVMVESVGGRMNVSDYGSLVNAAMMFSASGSGSRPEGEEYEGESENPILSTPPPSTPSATTPSKHRHIRRSGKPKPSPLVMTTEMLLSETGSQSQSQSQSHNSSSRYARQAQESAGVNAKKKSKKKGWVTWMLDLVSEEVEEGGGGGGEGDEYIEHYYYESGRGRGRGNVNANGSGTSPFEPSEVWVDEMSAASSLAMDTVVFIGHVDIALLSESDDDGDGEGEGGGKYSFNLCFEDSILQILSSPFSIHYDVTRVKCAYSDVRSGTPEYKPLFELYPPSSSSSSSVCVSSSALDRNGDMTDRDRDSVYLVGSLFEKHDGGVEALANQWSLYDHTRDQSILDAEVREVAEEEEEDILPPQWTSTNYSENENERKGKGKIRAADHREIGQASAGIGLEPKNRGIGIVVGWSQIEVDDEDETTAGTMGSISSMDIEVACGSSLLHFTYSDYGAAYMNLMYFFTKTNNKSKSGAASASVGEGESELDIDEYLRQLFMKWFVMRVTVSFENCRVLIDDLNVNPHSSPKCSSALDIQGGELIMSNQHFIDALDTAAALPTFTTKLAKLFANMEIDCTLESATFSAIVEAEAGSVEEVVLLTPFDCNVCVLMTQLPYVYHRISGVPTMSVIFTSPQIGLETSVKKLYRVFGIGGTGSDEYHSNGIAVDVDGVLASYSFGIDLGGGGGYEDIRLQLGGISADRIECAQCVEGAVNDGPQPLVVTCPYDGGGKWLDVWFRRSVKKNVSVRMGKSELNIDMGLPLFGSLLFGNRTSSSASHSSPPSSLSSLWHEWNTYELDIVIASSTVTISPKHYTCLCRHLSLPPPLPRHLPRTPSHTHTHSHSHAEHDIPSCYGECGSIMLFTPKVSVKDNRATISGGHWEAGRVYSPDGSSDSEPGFELSVEWKMARDMEKEKERIVVHVSLLDTSFTISPVLLQYCDMLYYLALVVGSESNTEVPSPAPPPSPSFHFDIPLELTLEAKSVGVEVWTKDMEKCSSAAAGNSLIRFKAAGVAVPIMLYPTDTTEMPVNPEVQAKANIMVDRIVSSYHSFVLGDDGDGECNTVALPLICIPGASGDRNIEVIGEESGKGKGKREKIEACSFNSSCGSGSGDLGLPPAISASVHYSSSLPSSSSLSLKLATQQCDVFVWMPAFSRLNAVFEMQIVNGYNAVHSDSGGGGGGGGATEEKEAKPSSVTASPEITVDIDIGRSRFWMPISEQSAVRCGVGSMFGEVPPSLLAGASIDRRLKRAEAEAEEDRSSSPSPLDFFMLEIGNICVRESVFSVSVTGLNIVCGMCGVNSDKSLVVISDTILPNVSLYTNTEVDSGSKSVSAHIGDVDIHLTRSQFWQLLSLLDHNIAPPSSSSSPPLSSRAPPTSTSPSSSPISFSVSAHSKAFALTLHSESESEADTSVKLTLADCDLKVKSGMGMGMAARIDRMYITYNNASDTSQLLLSVSSSKRSGAVCYSDSGCGGVVSTSTVSIGDVELEVFPDVLSFVTLYSAPIFYSPRPSPSPAPLPTTPSTTRSPLNVVIDSMAINVLNKARVKGVMLSTKQCSVVFSTSPTKIDTSLNAIQLDCIDRGRDGKCKSMLLHHVDVVSSVVVSTTGIACECEVFQCNLRVNFDNTHVLTSLLSDLSDFGSKTVSGVKVDVDGSSASSTASSSFSLSVRFPSSTYTLLTDDDYEFATLHYSPLTIHYDESRVAFDGKLAVSMVNYYDLTVIDLLSPVEMRVSIPLPFGQSEGGSGNSVNINIECGDLELHFGPRQMESLMKFKDVTYLHHFDIVNNTGIDMCFGQEETSEVIELDQSASRPYAWCCPHKPLRLRFCVREEDSVLRWSSGMSLDLDLNHNDKDKDKDTLLYCSVSTHQHRSMPTLDLVFVLSVKQGDLRTVVTINPSLVVQNNLAQPIEACVLRTVRRSASSLSTFATAPAPSQYNSSQRLSLSSLSLDPFTVPPMSSRAVLIECVSEEMNIAQWVVVRSVGQSGDAESEGEDRVVWSNPISIESCVSNEKVKVSRKKKNISDVQIDGLECWVKSYVNESTTTYPLIGDGCRVVSIDPICKLRNDLLVPMDVHINGLSVKSKCGSEDVVHLRAGEEITLDALPLDIASHKAMSRGRNQGMNIAIRPSSTANNGVMLAKSKSGQNWSKSIQISSRDFRSVQIYHSDGIDGDGDSDGNGEGNGSRGFSHIMSDFKIHGIRSQVYFNFNADHSGVCMSITSPLRITNEWSSQLYVRGVGVADTVVVKEDSECVVGLLWNSGTSETKDSHKELMVGMRFEAGSPVTWSAPIDVSDLDLGEEAKQKQKKKQKPKQKCRSRTLPLPVKNVALGLSTSPSSSSSSPTHAWPCSVVIDAPQAGTASKIEQSANQMKITAKSRYILRNHSSRRLLVVVGGKGSTQHKEIDEATLHLHSLLADASPMPDSDSHSEFQFKPLFISSPESAVPLGPIPLTRRGVLGEAGVRVALMSDERTVWSKEILITVNEPVTGRLMIDGFLMAYSISEIHSQISVILVDDPAPPFLVRNMLGFPIGILCEEGEYSTGTDRQDSVWRIKSRQCIPYSTPNADSHSDLLTSGQGQASDDVSVSSPCVVKVSIGRTVYSVDLRSGSEYRRLGESDVCVECRVFGGTYITTIFESNADKHLQSPQAPVQAEDTVTIASYGVDLKASSFSIRVSTDQFADGFDGDDARLSLSEVKCGVLYKTGSGNNSDFDVALSVGTIQLDDQREHATFPVVFLCGSGEGEGEDGLVISLSGGINRASDVDVYQADMSDCECVWVHQLKQRVVSSIVIDELFCTSSKIRLWVDDGFVSLITSSIMTWVMRCIGSLSVPAESSATVDEVGGEIVALKQQPSLIVSQCNIRVPILVVTALLSYPFFIGLDRTHVTLSTIHCTIPFATSPLQLSEAIVAQWVADSVLSVPSLLGSLEMLGNPAMLLRSFGEGARSLVQLPSSALRNQGFIPFAVSLGRGASNLLRRLTGGGLTAISGLSDSIGRNIALLASDVDSARSLAPAPQSAVSVADGVWQGMAGLARGVVSGLSGLVRQPMNNRSSTIGVTKGILGVVALPVSGVLEFVAQTSGGLANYAAGNGVPRRLAPRDGKEKEFTLAQQHYARVLKDSEYFIATIRGECIEPSSISLSSSSSSSSSSVGTLLLTTERLCLLVDELVYAAVDLSSIEVIERQTYHGDTVIYVAFTTAEWRLIPYLFEADQIDHFIDSVLFYWNCKNE